MRVLWGGKKKRCMTTCVYIYLHRIGEPRYNPQKQGREIDGRVVEMNAASGITLDEDKGRASCRNKVGGTRSYSGYGGGGGRSLP